MLYKKKVFQIKECESNVIGFWYFDFFIEM